MHEMAIAEGILDIALRYAKDNDASKIAEVGLAIGELSGVESESLLFCWESITADSAAEGARLVLRRVPLRGCCRECSFEAKIEKLNFICPRCGGTMELVQGRELKVEYLEVD